jgi:shikimate kinase
MLQPSLREKLQRSQESEGKVIKIFLVGIPNCGKSTLGQMVAEKLQLPFYDTDAMAKEKVGEMRLFDIFRASTHERLLEAQRNSLLELSEIETEAIVATGAEICLMPKCLAAMRKMGMIIHIKRDLALIFADLEKTQDDRVAMQNTETGEIFDFRANAAMSYAEELDEYDRAADLRMENNGSAQEGFDRLIELVTIIREIEKGNAV